METANTTSPLHSFDAKVWADDFCAIAKTLGHDLDKDWMLGWFANALMRGWDEHAKRNREKLVAFEPGGAVERFLIEWNQWEIDEDIPNNLQTVITDSKPF